MPIGTAQVEINSLKDYAIFSSNEGFYYAAIIN